MRTYAKSAAEYIMMMMKRYDGHGLGVMVLNAGGGTTTGVQGLRVNRSQQLSSYASPAPRICSRLNISSNIKRPHQMYNHSSSTSSKHYSILWIIITATQIIVHIPLKPYRVTSSALLSAPPFTATFNARKHLTSVYRPEDAPDQLDDDSDVDHPAEFEGIPTTVITAEVIAVPLLQQFRVCMSCWGKMTHLPQRAALGSCSLCGLTQKLDYCTPSTFAKSHDRFRADHCHPWCWRHCPKSSLPPRHSLTSFTPTAQKVYTEAHRLLHHQDHQTISATKDQDSYLYSYPITH